MFAYLLKREADIYNSLALSGMFILAIAPQQLFDIGFQLSFASVISIAYIYPKIKASLKVDSLKIKFVKAIIEGCLVSFSAWLGTLVFIAYYFRIVSPITVIANLFIVPLATLITLCGFSLISASLIFPVLIPAFSSTCQFVTFLMLSINSGLIKLPGSSFHFN